MSVSQLCKEPYNDLEILPLLEGAFDEKKIDQVPDFFYVQNGILMRKWRPLSRRRGSVNHQIVVPRVYRPNILNLANESPMSGHLGKK